MRNLLWALILIWGPVAAQAQATPCKSTVVGPLEIIPLKSEIFHNNRSLRVWLPPGYSDPSNAAKKYPVLYILDGDSVFDTCTAFMHDELHADETLTELITAGKIPPVIAVGVDNGSDVLGLNAKGENIDGGKQRELEYIPYPDTLLDPGVEVQGQQMPAFFEKEVMPVINGKYRVLTGTDNTTLWGDSYAGAAALYMAMHRPDLFSNFIIESPSLQIGNGQLLRDSQMLAVMPKRIALGIGTAEVSTTEFPNANALSASWVRLMRQLADNLKATAFLAPQVQLTVIEGLHHTTGDFGKRLEAGLLFIYAPQP